YSFVACFCTSTSSPQIHTLSLHDALPIFETSPRLIERQKEVLGSFKINIQWIDRFDAVPHGLLILVSNELFDALPIRQFVKYDGDRKSTRLNSSHVKISYAVFCLKKKN